MPNGSWQPDPYGRHQMRWWDGAQWTTMVSENGITHDENAALLPPPVLPPRRRNTALIATVAAVMLVAAGVVVFLVTRDDGADTVTSGTTASGLTQPTAPITGSNGHDSQTPEGQAYVDAMMQSAGDSGMSDLEARCIAEGTVDIIGVQALKDSGVTPEMVAEGGELLPDYVPTEAQASALLDTMFGCVDFGELMVAGMGVGVLPAEQVACIGDGLETDETFRSFLISSMISSASETETTDDPMALQSALIDIMMSCGVDPSTVGG